MHKGLLISFEGLDGAGKSTQVSMLCEWLQEQKLDFVSTREPGGTELGREIRDLLFGCPLGCDKHEHDLDALTETFLFMADRSRHFAKVVIPALKDGKIVITDRCYDSNIVYQGMVKGVGADFVENMSLAATRLCAPDLTILLDIPSEEVHKRRTSTGDISRFDAESIAFHRRVRSGFLKQAKKYPRRIIVFDGTRSVEEVHEGIVRVVLERFPQLRDPSHPQC